jgi:hypothetical protein
LEKIRLLKQINELETLNRSQILKINELKENIDELNTEVNQKTISSDKSIQALSMELRSHKQELEKSRNREKEVILFIYYIIEAFLPK